MVMQKRIENLINFIGTNLKEKDEALRLALLAAVAGESVFFLGPPGTAKSMVSRRLKYAFKGSEGNELNYFEYLMQQFSTPDELFGPVSLKALENDEYKRIINGFLPQADVVFLDEIWKAGPAIQNTLLTIINEKKFHNGKTVINVPLKVLISASNELPAENQGLEALWDRFLLRLVVNPISDENTFLELICGKKVKQDLEITENEKNLIISIDELNEWQKQIEEVSVPEEVCNVITAIRQEMQLRNNQEDRENKEKFYVSDRRWTKIVNILKTSAFLNGRNIVDLMDCQLIKYCIWNTENQIEEASEITEQCIVQNGTVSEKILMELKDKIRFFKNYINEKFFILENARPELFEMNDGTSAYKFVQEKKIYSLSSGALYIADNYDWRYDSHFGAYFDKNKNIIDGFENSFNSFKIKNDEVFWTEDDSGKKYNGKIHIEKSSYIKNSALYAPENSDKLKLRQNQAEEQYKLLAENIKNEINNIENIIKDKNNDFYSNLFTKHDIANYILVAYEDFRKKILDIQFELEEIRDSYK